MKLRRIKAIAVKEVLQIWRDPRSLMIALLLAVYARCSCSATGSTLTSSIFRSAPSIAKRSQAQPSPAQTF